jgi:hypothetical protein
VRPVALAKARQFDSSQKKNSQSPAEGKMMSERVTVEFSGIDEEVDK